MIFCDKDIARAVRRQQLVAKLEDPNSESVGGGLSPWALLCLWWLTRKPRIGLSPFDPRPADAGGRMNPHTYNLSLHGRMLVYDVPVERSPDRLFFDWDSVALDMKRDNPTREVLIPADGLILKPGRLYLGRTEEVIGLYNCMAILHGRSSIGRLGINVHATAGYCDAGFSGSLTLEITVTHPVRVYAGVQLCQLEFQPVPRGHRSYRGRKYQGQIDARESRLHAELAAEEPLCGSALTTKPNKPCAT